MQKLYGLAAICVILPLQAFGASDQTAFDLPSPSEGTGRKVQLWATHYFIHQAKPAAAGLPFKDSAGKLLSDNVSPRDWCLGAIEGTIYVQYRSMPRTINYSGKGMTSQVDCAAVLRINQSKKPWIASIGKSYFSLAKGPYGDGVQGYKLRPYRTIAVDKNIIPYGTVLFVPKAKGSTIQLPSGVAVTHDGYFFAGDTGGAIKGNHIDVFCGNQSENCFPDFIASNPNQTVEAIIIDDASIISTLRQLHLASDP
jgi:3D (Asp-Asp-Asp) domain-containing protein